jgi:hypothetical protein
MPRGRQRRDASEARAAMPRRLDGRGAQTLRTFIIGRISSGWGGPERSLRRWRRRRQSAARRLHSGGHVRCVRVGRARAMHADAQRAQPRSMSETGHLPTDVESSDPDPGAATLQPGALRPSAPPPLRPSVPPPLPPHLVSPLVSLLPARRDHSILRSRNLCPPRGSA